MQLVDQYPGTPLVYTQQACQANELVSLARRHLISNAEGMPGLYDMLEEAYDLAVECFPDLVKPVQQSSLQEVVDAKPTAKRARYQRAVNNIKHRGLPKTRYNISAFVKVEKWDEAQLGKKAPRMIQYRHEETAAVYGRWVHNAEEALWQACDPDGHPLFAKKMNSFTLAKTIVDAWNSFEDPMARLMDHSKFDACHTTDHIHIEMKWFRDMCGDQEELMQRLARQLYNNCYSKNGIRYSAVGRKNSGELTTSSGGSLLNITTLVYMARSVLREWLVDIMAGLSTACPVKFIINGDDSIMIYDRSNDRYMVDSVPWYTSVVERAYVLEHVEFCQTRPVQVRPDVWRMVRNPLRAISRASSSVKRYSDSGWLRLVASMGMSEMACNDGVPVLQSFAAYLLAAARGSKPIVRELSHRYELENVKRPKSRPIHDIARESFYRAWALGPAEQVDMEKWYERQAPLVIPYELGERRLALYRQYAVELVNTSHRYHPDFLLPGRDAVRPEVI